MKCKYTDQMQVIITASSIWNIRGSWPDHNGTRQHFTAPNESNW